MNRCWHAVSQEFSAVLELNDPMPVSIFHEELRTEPTALMMVLWHCCSLLPLARSSYNLEICEKMPGKRKVVLDAMIGSARHGQAAGWIVACFDDNSLVLQLRAR